MTRLVQTGAPQWAANHEAASEAVSAAASRREGGQADGPSDALCAGVQTRPATVIPVRIKRSGGRKWLIPAPNSVEEPPAFNTPILSALSRALHWQRLLDEGRVASGREIASREGLHPTTVNELLRLALLSPQGVQALLAGRQPRTLSLAWLKSHELPRSWDEQDALFGLMDD